MVFAIQCPHPRCKKFMLVEDRDRGKTVHCLICKTAIRLTSINKDKEKGKGNDRGTG